MAEDDPDDRMLTKLAFEEAHLANDLRFVEDGEELMDYLHQMGKYWLEIVELPCPEMEVPDEQRSDASPARR
jgi:hypothetical protein